MSRWACGAWHAAFGAPCTCTASVHLHLPPYPHLVPNPDPDSHNPHLPHLQVIRDGSGMMGIVDYANRDDMETALRKLDGSDFKNVSSNC